MYIKKMKITAHINKCFIYNISSFKFVIYNYCTDKSVILFLRVLPEK